METQRAFGPKVTYQQLNGKAPNNNNNNKERLI